MLTDRLELRAPVEADRKRFVELFGREDFMVFSDGVHSPESAHARFDQMLLDASELPFTKQPVIERSSGTIVGYSGMIDPKNAPSQNVAAKLGFTYWKQAVVNGYLDNLYRLAVP